MRFNVSHAKSRVTALSIHRVGVHRRELEGSRRSNHHEECNREILRWNGSRVGFLPDKHRVFQYEMVSKTRSE